MDRSIDLRRTSLSDRNAARFVFRSLILVCVWLLAIQGATAQLSGYSFRKKITIDNTKVSGTADHLNFPALITLTDTDLRTVLNGGDVTNDNGYDIAFTDIDGTTQLDHEIVAFVPTTGELRVWVKIPVLDHDDNTEFYMYYGNVSATSDPSSTGTWEDFIGVWHLEESGNGTAGEYKESSVSANGGRGGNGNVNKVPTQVAGKIGFAQEFDEDVVAADGSGDYIKLTEVGDIGSVVTVSAWVNHNAVNTLEQRYINIANDVVLRYDGLNAVEQLHFDLDYVTGNGEVRVDNMIETTGTWYHVAASFDGTNLIVYRNGTQVGSAVAAGTLPDMNTNTGISQAAEWMDGIIDEVHVSTVARSEAWLATEYTNQDDPANFILAPGAEEPVSAPGNVSASVIIWLKADAGVLNAPALTAWADQTGLSNAVAVASGDPQWVEESINFNPAIDFDGTGDYLETITASILGNDSDYTKFAVVVSDNTSTVAQIISSDGAGSHEMRQGSSGRLRAEHGGITLFGGSPILTQGQTHLAVIRYGDGLNEFAAVDGEKLEDLTAHPSSYTDGGSVQVGAYNDNLAGDSWDGLISEVIITNDELSDNDISKIQSYLAIKYGIALDATAGSYLASDGTTVLWDPSTNSSYHNDVAGIGRDDDTGLDQQKSISSNSDAMVIVDKGGSFASDKDFILWGNDNGATTLTTTDKHPDYDERLEREWRAAVNGSPGTTTVQMIYSANNGTTSSYALLIDGDGSFSLGATSVPASSISGDTITFTNVTIDDGDYFTLAERSQYAAGPLGPGGIGDTDGTSNLTLWLDASNITGVTDGADISGWSDLSGYGNNAAVGNAPSYTTSWGGNSQPAVTFNAGSSEYLSVNANSDVKPTSELSVFIAGNVDSGSPNYGSLINTASNSLWEDGWGIAKETTGAIQYFTDWNDPYGQTRLSLNGGIDDNDHIYGMLHAGTTSTAYEDGSSGTFSPGTLSYTNPNDNVLIGAGPDNIGAAYFMTGEIAEVILFNAELNLAQQIILNNYLSAKYNIALTANDVYQQDNNGFDFDVAGIGQASDDSNHTDAQGTGIVRMLNPSGLGTDEFLMWGHDNGRMEAYETTDVPSGVAARLTGQWRVSELNTSLSSVDVGSVDIVFDLSGLGEVNDSDLVLLVDTDNDGFADETPITGASFQLDDYYMFTGVTALADGYHFTLGTADRTQTPLISGAFGSDGPGGVGSTDGTSDLVMWLDAGSLSAGPVTTWSDQSGYGNDALVDSYGSPGYSATGMSNSQPAVTFTQSNSESLYVPGNSTILPTDALSVFVVGNYIDGSSENNAGFLCAFNDGGRNDGWAIKQDGGNLDMQFWLDDQSTNVCTKTFTSGADEIWGLTFDGSTGSGFLSEDSCGYSFAGPITYNTGKNDDLLIGVTMWNSGPSYFMEGEIGEIIEFNTAVNDAQRIIISNYLSAKYAIGLSAYDVYDEDDLGYDFEVAGIGQSSGGDIHNDAQGQGIFRMLNPASLANGSYLMWGHDNGALTDTETADIPSNVNKRLERIWAVSETADVGAVDIIVDLSSLGVEDASLVRLLVDTNGGGFSDATVISGAIGLTNNAFMFSAETALVDNARFTVGLLQPGPGYVTADLQVWLKSDEGTTGGTTITAWNDQSGNDNNADNVTGDPEYLDNILNYNPAIEFDGVSDYLSTTATSIIGNDGDYTKYAVVVSHDVTTGQSIIGSDNSGDHDLRQNSSGTLQVRQGGVNWGGPGTFILNQAHVVGARYGSAAPDNMTSFDGSKNTNTTTYTFTDAGAIEIGTRNSGAFLFDGYIAEAIVYNSEKSDSEVAQIESYLAMKYGVTLDGDYVDSNGSPLWNSAGAGSYNQDIIAIGRDDNSGLYQRQSRTQDDSLKVYISSLANSNILNTGEITTDVSYLIIGHNGGDLQASATANAEAPSGIESRFEREWRITNTNFSGDYTLEFEWRELGNFDISHIRLLVDADGDFSNATIYGAPDVTIVEGSIIVSGVGTNEIPMNSTMYVTVGSTDASTTLPIELISFEAQVIDEGSAVQLDWSTASEKDNDYFTVERSQDSEVWKDILIIPGAGNSSGRLDYAAYDDDPLYGLSYYRLKQTDFDGAYSYSNTVFVTLGNFVDELTIYPNPTQDRITIKGSPEEIRVLRLFNSQGQDLTGQLKVNRREAQTVTLEVSHLPVGIYHIRTASKTIKMIKSP